MSRPTEFFVEDELVYWDVSIVSSDGTPLDADSNPTIQYRVHGNDTLKSTGVTVTKVAATTGLYRVAHNLAGDSDLGIGASIRYQETATISAVAYVNRWSTMIRGVATLAGQVSQTGLLNILTVQSNSIDSRTLWINAVTNQMVFSVANQLDCNSLTGGTSPSAVADAVWDESLSAHQSAGSTGLGLTSAAATGGDATAANQTAIIAKLQTNPIEIVNPIVTGNTLALVNKDNYSATNGRLITFPVGIDYTSATSVKLIFSVGGANVKVTGAVVASATSITVDVNIDFGASLTFASCNGSVCNQVATCDFSLVAKYGTDEETITYGTAYIYDRAVEA